MDISARAISLTDRPQRGHVGQQGSHASGRPILHLFSFSRRPRRVRVLITSSIASWLCTVPLFVPGGRSFVPTCGCRGAPRAGTVKVGRRACLVAPVLPGHTLTGPSTARGLASSGKLVVATGLERSKVPPAGVVLDILNLHSWVCKACFPSKPRSYTNRARPNIRGNRHE